METNNKTFKHEVVKNEHYQAMLSHLDNAVKTWQNFSRLDRLEYAYKCLELSIQYNCSVHNLDASSITAALELLDHNGETHTVQTADSKIQSVVALSVRDTLAAFKSSPEQILFTALHETKHACDAQFMERPYFDNKPNMGQVKVGDIVLPNGYHNEISKSYREFGIAWQGRDLEISANETAYGVTNSLLEDLLEQNPNSISYQARATKFSNEAAKHLDLQHKAEIELKTWKEELLQKYVPDGIEKLPVVTEDMLQSDFIAPNHPFVDIETIREVAEQNPEVFKTQCFVSSELDGATTKAEADEKGPEVAQTFIENNNIVIQKVEQAITPQTTLDFIHNAPAMELN